jgi:hypothetical protein
MYHSSQLSKKRGNTLFILVSVLLLLTLLSTLPFNKVSQALADSESPQTAIITAWQTERVTDTKAFAWMGDRSMRVDSNGNIHIAYGADHLYYAYYNGSTWTKETVDSRYGVGLYASLALDSANHPYVSYYDASTGSLMFTRKVGAAWDTPIALDTPNMASAFTFNEGEGPSLEGLPVNQVDIQKWADMQANSVNTDASIQLSFLAKGRGLYTSIALDTFDNPHIAYYDAANGNLKYAFKGYSNWSINTIDADNDTGLFASIAVGRDATDKKFTHFSYYDATAKDLRYAKWSATDAKVIERTSVDGNSNDDVGQYTSMALTYENDQKPRISYYVYVDSSNAFLKFAKYNGSSWEKQLVTPAGQQSGKFTSLALDKNNTPHITYLNTSSSRLKLAIPDSNTTWSTTEIASVGGSVYSSLAINTKVADAQADARVSFFDAGTGVLKFATQTGQATWNTVSVDNSTDLGSFNSVAFDSAGNPHIVFFDDTNDDLMYVKWNGTAWEGPSVVDQNGVTGLYNDIAIGPDGKIHIAFYNYGSTCLRYATGGPGAWAIENVETANTNGNCAKVGKYASIAVDHLNRPHIAYYDEAEGNLKWAYKDGTWKVAYVDTDGDVGLYSSIAIDSNNLPRISYFDFTNKNLRYAAFGQDSKWKVEQHVNQQNTQAGQYSQLSLDSQNHPHIVYMDDSAEDTIRYAWKTDLTSTLWGYETIEPGVSVFGSTGQSIAPLAIVAASDGTINISYFEFGAKSLHYARKANGVWSYSIVDNSGNVGQYSSIAINNAGTVGISYYDALNGDLKYAKGTLVTLPYSIFLPVIVR